MGFTSFGGPVAAIGYFRAEFVTRRKWFNDHTFIDMIALCQFLPGPVSSQLGISIGFAKGGIPGALLAWLGFTMPSAILMIIFGLGVSSFGDVTHQGWMSGLKIVTVAVVAQAVLAMARIFCVDWKKTLLTVFAAIVMIFLPLAITQITLMIFGGIVGLLLLIPNHNGQHTSLGIRLKRHISIGALIVFFVLLFVLPVLMILYPSHILEVIDSFYRSGALVFGGGHVVLPLLQATVVQPGWVSNESFLAGYAMAQALPGPLYSFAAYLGSIMSEAPNGWSGGMLCLVAIYLPSFLLVIGILPFWDKLRKVYKVQTSLAGVNAVVVGILLAALYNPVWKMGILSWADFGFAVLLFCLLQFGRVQPWMVVVFGATIGEILTRLY